MKKLILVRSGLRDVNGKLTVAGFSQTVELANRLKISHLQTNSLVIISSPAHHALETAGIMARISMEKVEESSFLLMEQGDADSGRPMLEMLQSRWDEAEIFLLVTHGEYIRYFPGYFGPRCLGQTWAPFAIGNSEAMVIDCVAKKMDYVHLW